MNRKRVGVVVLVGLLVAAVAIWLIPSRGPALSFKLPDGTTLSVFRVTYGTNHEVVYANDWRDRFSRFVPARYATNLGFKRMQVPSTMYHTDNLIVWLKRSGPVPGPAPTNAGSQLPRVSGSVVDDNGLEAGTSTITWNGTFMAWLLPNYPRRSRIIHLRCWDTSAPTTGGAAQPLLATLEIPNPARSTAAPWVAETLPAVRITNGLEVSLLELKTGYSAASAGMRGGGIGRGTTFFGGSFGGGLRGISSGGMGIGGRGFLPATNSRSYSLARVQLRENGQPATNWVVQGLQASALTGTSVMMQSAARPASAGPNDYYFTGVFWPEEPAWEATIEVARQSDFPAEETWKITGIPVPKTADDQHDSADIETNMSGVHLAFHVPSSGPPGFGSLPSGFGAPLVSRPATPGTWTLYITSDSATDVQPKLVSLRTDTGEILQQRGSSMSTRATSGGPGSTTYGFSFQVPDDATALDATFVVSQPRYVTFRVKPTLAP